MELKFGVKGPERKKLAEEIGTFLKADVEYLGVPSCSYKIRSIEIDKNGTMIIGNRMADDTVKALLNHLKSEGYKEGMTSKNSKVAVPKARPEKKELEKKEQKQKEPRVPRERIEVPNDSKIDGYSISFPLENYDETAIANIKAIIESKANLMKKVFETNDLSVETKDGKLTFNWFNEKTTPEELKAYSQFLSKLCYMGKSQKKVNAKEKEVESEKYAFRCFLLRLDMIGDEYKFARKVLLKNLSGSSSFRKGDDND